MIDTHSNKGKPKYMKFKTLSKFWYQVTVINISMINPRVKDSLDDQNYDTQNVISTDSLEIHDYKFIDQESFLKENAVT